jgi:hypothetical protein
MEGRIWIASKESRLAEIDGHLTDAVRFGGGLLGHLDKGGQFHVKQSEVAPGHWETTEMNINMRGKALFFKTIEVQQHETQTRFQRVPDDLTLAQAAERLFGLKQARNLRRWNLIRKGLRGLSSEQTCDQHGN